MRFSIIVPAYNAEGDIEACLSSALSQDFDPAAFEVVVADDCSTDGTRRVAERLAQAHPNLKVASTASNAGPGPARNAGIAMASGEWLVFLDSDDALHLDMLRRLGEHLDREHGDDADVVAFDWRYRAASGQPQGGRRDRDALAGSREGLLARYLALQMDGSVIYAAMRRRMLLEHQLAFAPGLHEDVDFLFRAYFHARRVLYLDEALYIKHQRQGSIVNTISERHLSGFMRAWRAIGEFLDRARPPGWQAMLDRHAAGLIAVIATRVREIANREAGARAATLYGTLLDACPALPPAAARSLEAPVTKYERIAAHFFVAMRDPAVQLEDRAASITAFMKDIAGKSWSCVDLHHSAFLAPDQIRTCCKRFFVNGEMRGDVALIDVPEGRAAQPTARSILLAKQDLHARINMGAQSGCDGCPFLEFKEWEPLDRLNIRYLSLEHHSICNLKCSYCSETYYGGAKARYDVDALVDDLKESRALEECATAVWGGGEPTLGKNFAPLLDRLVGWLPRSNHRVLTNSVQLSKTVERLLADDRIAITTSVDAGTEGIFLLVRGRPRLRRVLGNLRKYASINPQNVTVKYIFTEENCGLEEVRAFVALAQEYALMRCNFQISSDFKQEAITRDAAISMIAMYGLLTAAGAEVVFFDDLLRQRLSDIQSASDAEIREALSGIGLPGVLADPRAMPAIAIWGAGWLAKYLMEKSSFCSRAEIAFFVDSTPSKIGTTFMGRKVHAPSVLFESEIPVAIAAAQSFPIIHRKYVEMGLPPERLVRQLIL